MFKSKREKFKHWDQAVPRLLKTLEAAEVRVLDDTEEGSLETRCGRIPYGEWILTQDATLGRDNGENVGGIEVVSAVHCSNSSIWQKEFRMLWACMLKDFGLQQSTRCGTHIHVSTSSHMTSPKPSTALRQLAKAIVYFERCVDSLMPRSRLGQNQYCKSNWWNSKLRTLDMRQIFNMIDGVQSLEALTDLLCFDEKTSGAARYFKWNFTPLKDSKGTVEFRQPPGSTTQEDALVWTEFAQAFVQGAMETNLFREGPRGDGKEWQVPHPPALKHLQMMMWRSKVSLDLIARATQLGELNLQDVLGAEATGAARGDVTRDSAERQRHEAMKLDRVTAALRDSEM